uniref:Reverse transcriptase domain-containing protein n=1 Tax=Tanacetum cinerariifolium TaxID=118510 RepID=A0A6L2MQC7_TANCI|nr:reverse transcriptase domain-containing protein [Tanacetum cinerariifolium]
MAARTVKALGNYRGRRALYNSMDEFYDSDVTITIQRHHWKAWDKRNPSTTIHDSRNAQIPRDYYWRKSIDKSTNGTVHTLEEKLRYIRMAAVKHDRSITIDCRAPTQYPRRILPCQTEKIRAGPGALQGNPSGGTKTGRGRNSTRSILSRLVIQPGHGYLKIQMVEQNEEKTAFHTSHGVYCYTKIPFGLKNAGATYQRLLDKDFDKQIGWNLEIYVDDLVIKSHTETELLQDIEVTFRKLRRINMKLNPKKCTFGAAEGMFLGYMINPKGIKPCLDKTEVVLQLPSPRTIKEVQSLNGKLASLNRFISKSAEKSLPLFKTLKKCIKKSDFHWTPDVEQAFKQLKQHLAKLPMLGHNSDTGLFCVPTAASSQAKLYPNGKASHGASLRSQEVVQILPGLSYRGHHRPAIKQVMSHPEVAGRLQKYSPNDASPNASMIETPEDPWILFMDGSSCIDGLGVGLILTSPEGKEFTYALRFQFTASNNEAEYEALIASLWIAAQMGVGNVHVSVDSKLVANQVLGTYVAKEENMVKYLEKAKSLISGFANFFITQVPRSKNKKADALSKITSTSFTHLSKQVLVEVLKEKSIQEEEVATVIEEKGTNMDDPDNRTFERWDPSRNPQQPLTSITAPWPFYKWEIDIAGPFPKGPGKVKFLIVAVDYFTKWIEAKAVETITGSQFSDNSFKDWCEKLNITQRFALVKHPQSNRLAESANWSLGEGIKARLDEGNKNWIEKLPHVLWAHRTMIKSSHDDTPFSLTYGTEAVIPAESRMPTYRTAVVSAVHNNEELRLNLDLSEERRECAAIREAKAKLKMTKYYTTRVRGVTFRPEDFVYRSYKASHAMERGKLGPKWEGPYEVTEALGDGAYRIRSMDGTVLPRTWNVANLKKSYL